MNDAQAMAGKPQAASENRKAGSASKAVAKGHTVQYLEPLHQRIAVAAYYRSQGRNFEPGHELEDWLGAEAELLAEMESLKGLPA